MYYCMYQMDENVCDCIQVLLLHCSVMIPIGAILLAPLHECARTRIDRVQCRGYHAHFTNCMYVSSAMCVCQQDVMNWRDVCPSVTKG